MSDEQPPPPPALRLKPRLRPPDTETPPATPPSAAESPPPAPSAATPAPEASAPQKIRLKPRLAADGSPAAEPATAAPEAPPAVVLPPAPAAAETPAPAVAAPSEAENAEGAPRIRLKPRGDAPPAAPAPAPAAAAPAVIPAAPPPPPPPAAVPSAAAAPEAPAAEGSKFKLKPKAPPAVPPPGTASAGAGAASIPAAAPPAMIGGVPIAPQPAAAPKAPPPFPVVAPPPKPGGTAPPVPHIELKSEVTDVPPLLEQPARVPFWKKKSVQLVGLAALLVIGAGVWFGPGLIEKFTTDEAPPAPAKPTAATPAQKAPSAPATKAPAPGPTPSETLNAIAQAPGNAVRKAQDVVNTRRDSEQTRVGEMLDPPVPAPTKGSAKAPSSQPGTAVTTVAPGISATTPLDAAPEASQAFRSFVANVRISSVLQGDPPRALINGKLTRAGDTVDNGLGIIFSGLDIEKRHVIFKDRTGASVSRRY